MVTSLFSLNTPVLKGVSGSKQRERLIEKVDDYKKQKNCKNRKSAKYPYKDFVYELKV